MGWADFCDQRRRLGRLAQIGGMPDDIGGGFAIAAAVDRMDIASFQRQPAQAMRSDKTGSAGNKDAPHSEKSGQLASRSAMTVGAAGHWIANAGSFQRTPRASSGT